jgi:NitT/TauT family transport system permease protein
MTVTFFLALFRGSELGLEAASVFAVFTSQAWNITFSFYHSLVTQSGELDEASRLMGLSRWKRFWSIDVPGGAIGLVWNGMMSFGGSWFFLTASELIIVGGHRAGRVPGLCHRGDHRGWRGQERLHRG